MPALVLASYRDDELDRAHPLRLVARRARHDAAVTRLVLAPLSPAAVGELAEPHGVDAGELHRRTGGNPFFVTEVLAAGGGEIPATVRDAVLARAARLSARRAQRCSRRSRSCRRGPSCGCSRRSPPAELDAPRGVPGARAC